MRPWTIPQISQIYRDWEVPFLALKRMPVIIGLTGPTLSGKTVAAKRLVTEFGFHYENMSDILTKIAHDRGMIYESKKNIIDARLKFEWEILGEIAEEMRRNNGPDILGRLLLDKIRYKLKENTRFVIDQILHPAELEIFSKIPSFAVIGFKASLDVRVNAASIWFERSAAEINQEIESRDNFEQYEVGNKEYHYDEFRANVDECLKFAAKYGKLIIIDTRICEATIFDPVDEYIRDKFGIISSRDNY
jgi:dephospho-CoA kinase